MLSIIFEVLINLVDFRLRSCVFGGAVSWASKIQRSVSLSTTEAEFVAASVAFQTIIWLSCLYKEIRGDEVIPVLNIDNQSAIKLIKNPQFHFKTKHIDTRFKFVRDLYGKKRFDVQYVKSND